MNVNIKIINLTIIWYKANDKQYQAKNAPVVASAIVASAHLMASNYWWLDNIRLPRLEEFPPLQWSRHNCYSVRWHFNFWDPIIHGLKSFWQKPNQVWREWCLPIILKLQESSRRSQRILQENARSWREHFPRAYWQRGSVYVFGNTGLASENHEERHRDVLDEASELEVIRQFRQHFTDALIDAWNRC